MHSHREASELGNRNGLVEQYLESFHGRVGGDFERAARHSARDFGGDVCFLHDFELCGIRISVLRNEPDIARFVEVGEHVFA